MCKILVIVNDCYCALL